MDDFDKSEKAEWLRSRVAEELRKDLRGKLVWARENLHGAAEKSTDPAVRAAYERYRATEEMLWLLNE